MQAFSDGFEPDALPFGLALVILTAICLLALYSRCRTTVRSRRLTMAAVDPAYSASPYTLTSMVRQAPAPARFKLPSPYFTGVSRYTLPSPYRAVQGGPS